MNNQPYTTQQSNGQAVSLFLTAFFFFGVDLFLDLTLPFIFFGTTVLFDIGFLFRLDAVLNFSLRVPSSPVRSIFGLLLLLFFGLAFFLGYPSVAFDNHNNLPNATQQSNGRYVSHSFLNKFSSRVPSSPVRSIFGLLLLLFFGLAFFLAIPWCLSTITTIYPKQHNNQTVGMFLFLS